MFRLLLISFSIIVITQTQTDIITTEDFSIVKEKLLSADNNTLIVFDCDDVLLEGKDRILQADNQDKKHELLKDDKYFTKIISQMKKQLVDNRWPSLISDLQDSGRKTISLTASPCGKIGEETENYEDIRKRELEENKINFGKQWNNEEISFNELTFTYNNSKRTPIFKYGILFTGKSPKDKLLENFLEKYSTYKFNKMIFIDDKLKYVESIKELCERKDIKFTGIHYTFAKTKKRTPLDFKLAEKQFKVLYETGKWISEEDLQ